MSERESIVEQDIWERKYHLALERMERDERDFRELEAGLRRLGLRLAALARGQDSSVDALLDRMNHELKGTPSAAVLDDLLAKLSHAVTALDHTVQDREAAAPVARQDETSTVEALRGDIARLQELLAAVSTRLGDMTRYLAAELESSDGGDGESKTLDATVREEMRALGEKTLKATDLGELQAEVNARLSFIDRHFREYRQREDSRLATWRARADRMRDRVAELETQATSLQVSLAREHVLALTDPLTGLPNRLAYEGRMAEIEAGVRNDGLLACVGAFDIDHFKAINDSLGHAAGDAVLRIVGKVLAKEMEGRGFVARYGGEEFVVIFAGHTPASALPMAEALCSTVAGLAFHASSRPVNITMSGGIACFHAAESGATVFDRADRALYTAKRAGRNRCAVL